MESTVVRSECRRGRKRKRKDVENPQIDGQRKQLASATRSKALVGRYLKKKFEGSGIFLGKVVSYDSGLYRIEYEDGDCEDLESGELKEFLIGDDDFVGKWIERKKVLDELVSSKDVSVENVIENVNATHGPEPSSLTELRKNFATEIDVHQFDDDTDSSSDSCECKQELDVEAPPFPPPHLPPSSGNIGVPEECISHLLSVYSFLRSFSIRLFLSPFGLDDFVGSLNCSVPNTLLDSIHVALMRALRRHFETLASGGSEIASKCLRLIDWSLLDALTWPVYLVQYLMVLGYAEGHEWKGFYVDSLKRDYYTLHVGRKLMILQILCDDVLDSEELRAEIDMREECEVGLDSDAVTFSAPENGPRRVHPRYSKTSACKDQEAMKIIKGSHETKSFCTSNSFELNGAGQDASAEVDQDGNGDECRLCGMDGILLCCDGCPSAYHSRCIGVTKLHIPDGAWYCPECTINKTGPAITKGTSLRGADIFGVDPYGQVFLGSCNHLLVLKVSINSEPFLRYYNQNDIQSVFRTLTASSQHVTMYMEICKGILRYWELPETVLSFAVTTGMGVEATEKKVDLCSATLSNMSSKESNDAPKIIKGPSMSALSANQAVPSDLTQQTLTDTSILAESVKLKLENENGSYTSCQNFMPIVAKNPTQSVEANGASGRSFRNSVEDCIYMGSSFKCQAYVNSYMHGDFAASAAANLAVLSSEENQVLESQGSENHRKVMSASVLLQVKAFSSAAVRFFWPNSEKKLMEVPRERCGWCLSCKAPVTSKRGCLLNATASNAIRGSLKILSGLRPVKNGDVLHAIATYVMLMEESLCGLTTGPFLGADFRKQWRKQVEQATTFSSIKRLLLELEENIRIVALSGDWVKLFDNWLVESSVPQSSASAPVSTQKRALSGRRGRKPAAMPEVPINIPKDVSDIYWWRGGVVSKFLFQKGTLPHPIVKKAARRGTSRKIPGIYYSEGCELPKRSRQIVWRASVEMSRNAAQLALQVRYLDLHVRWSDLARPEQGLQDGKGPETEASAFRNACICGKQIVEDKIRYAIAFGNQKHLPSRVLKNIIEIEKNQDGKEKYWFCETRVPLYLIKEYEENVAKVLQFSSPKPVNGLSKLQRRQLKASRRDIFSYLSRKRDNMDMCCCASCQQDVLLGKAVKCGACEGYCHEQCTVSSTSRMKEKLELLITCNQCNPTKTLTQSVKSKSPTSPLLLQGQVFQNAVTVSKAGRQIEHNRSLAPVRISECSSEVNLTNDSSSGTKSKRRLCSWGLLWKKKNMEDTGIDFRLKNILLKGNPDRNWSAPKCHLCSKPYNSNLMYIRCDTCNNWYHAEALELEESKIFDLVGFKCCKCRRIKSPVCPYLDPGTRKQVESKKPRIRASKKGTKGMDSHSEKTHQQLLQELEPATPVLPMKDEALYVPDDDHLLYSHSGVDYFSGHNTKADTERNTSAVSGPGPRKLPVRRQTKLEKDVGVSPNKTSHFETSTGIGSNISTPKEESLGHVEWNASTNGSQDHMMVDYESMNYEDMEFEPQTYFSFTELLASDEDDQLYGVDPSMNDEEILKNTSTFALERVPDNACDWQEPTSSLGSAVDMVLSCKLCSGTDPYPDLCCDVCGLWMHSHCSPLDEQWPEESSWRCSNCREWR